MLPKVLAFVVCVSFVACAKDTSKDAEIAALRAQLGKKEAPAPNPQPETVPPPVTAGSAAPPVAETPPPSAAPPVGYLWRFDQGTVTPDDVKQIILDAAANKVITYAHLKKNAARYIGKPWRLTGRILEIAEVGNRTRGRISLSDYADQAMYFEYAGQTDFVEHNVVEIAGILTNMFEYKSQAGWDISIPAIGAVAITKPGQLNKIAGIKHRQVAQNDE